MIYAMEKLSGKLVKELECLIAEQETELWYDIEDEIDLDWEAYYAAEDAGIFYLFTVRDADQLIGYCSFFISSDPHYKTRLSAQQDSLFVLKDYRAKGVGDKLIDYCDTVLENDFKVKSIHHSVNMKIDFSPLLERKGYKFTEKLMIKRFT